MSFEVFTTFIFELGFKVVSAFFLYMSDPNLAYAYISYEAYRYYQMFQRIMKFRQFLKSSKLEKLDDGVYKYEKKDEEE